MQKLYLLIYLLCRLAVRLFMLALHVFAIPVILVVICIQKLRGKLPNYTELELDILRRAEDTVSRYRTALLKLDHSYYEAAEKILKAKENYERNGGSELPFPLGKVILAQFRQEEADGMHRVWEHFRLDELQDEVHDS